MGDISLFFKKLKDLYNSDNKTVITNKFFMSGYNSVKIITPKIGDKKKLLELAKINVDEFKHNLRIITPLKSDRKDILLSIKEKLDLKKIPKTIECFDNSNLCGRYPVSSCVVFKNGLPDKSEYKRFNIRTVVGPDDCKTMKEIIYRRYQNNKHLPDLIIVDGGKGQLNSAVKVLKDLNIFGKVEVCSLAKRLEEIFIYNRKDPILLDEGSEELKLIQFIRDEAHHCAVTFHRKIRDKDLVKKK